MSWSGFVNSAKNALLAFLRGELLLRLGFDKLFLHIAYTFALFWLIILADILMENTFSKVEKNRETLTTLKIRHSEKVVEMVSLNRISTISRLLEEKGSDVAIPQKPAVRIDAKEKDGD